MDHSQIANPAILPSILSADFSRLLEDTADALRLTRQKIIHIDVMDGHLVPNISFGAPVYKWLRPKLKGVFFDVHLMIDEPVRYAGDFANAGADNITFHIEAPEVRDDPVRAAKAIRKHGTTVGVTLKPGTPIESIYPVLRHVDLVLIMSVEPGFGGQKFMPEMLEKVRKIKPKLKAHQRLEIDGGINLDTIAEARAAGVEWFVVGSALFDATDRAATVRSMKAKLNHR